MIGIILVVTGIVFVGMTGTIVYDSVLQSKKDYQLDMIDELTKRGADINNIIEENVK